MPFEHGLGKIQESRLVRLPPNRQNRIDFDAADLFEALPQLALIGYGWVEAEKVPVVVNGLKHTFIDERCDQIVVLEIAPVDNLPLARFCIIPGGGTGFCCPKTDRQTTTLELAEINGGRRIQTEADIHVDVDPIGISV